MKNFKAIFAKPDRDFWPWGIWIWNLRITEKELINQISLLAAHGFGGLAIKPVPGMTPEYLSEEFFELFNLVLTKAQKLNIKIRLINTFTENSIWNQELLLKRMRAQNLVFAQCSGSKDSEKIKLEEVNPEKNVVIAIRKKEIENVSADVKVLKGKVEGMNYEYKLPSDDWKVMVFRKEFLKNFYGKYIPNILNKDVSKIYINVLDKFCKRFLKFIPDTFQGFINEIPEVYQLKNNIIWDDCLKIAFKNRYKKDLLTHIPALFCDNFNLAYSVQAQMFECINEIMTMNFLKPFDEWVNKNGMTQWVLYPDSYLDKELHGTDLKNKNGLKQCALGLQMPKDKNNNYQLKKSIVSNIIMHEKHSEILNVIGSDRLFQGGIIQSLKDEFDKSVHYGITRTIINGSLFNVDPDYHIQKCCFSKHSPEWKHVHLLCKYISRMHYILKDIRWNRPVAILSPWVLTKSSFENSIGNPIVMNEILNVVKNSGACYSIINEELLCNCSILSNREISISNDRFCGNYKMLVIPDTPCLSDQALKIIVNLLKKGGRILFINSVPRTLKKLLNGKDGKEIRSITLGELKEELKSLSIIKFRSDDKSDSDLYYSYGTGDEYDLWILYNSSTKYIKNLKLSAPLDDRCYYSINCGNSEICEIKDYQKREDSCNIPVTLSPLSTVVIISAEKNKIIGVSKKARNKSISNRKNGFYSIMLKNMWDFEPKSFNALPLSTWNLRFGLSRGSGTFSRYYESYFCVKDIQLCCYLVLRNVDLSCFPKEVLLNGARVNVSKGINTEGVKCENDRKLLSDLFTFTSSQFGSQSVLYDISKNVIKGFNRISIRFSGKESTESGLLTLPPVITGNFAISKSSNGWIIENHHGIAGYDSWTKSGYPFMSGSGIYRQSFEIPTEYKKLILRFTKVSGPVDLYINDKNLGVYCWYPLEIDITDFCENKRNELTVNVINTLDNLLGMNAQLSGLTGEVFLDVY